MSLLNQSPVLGYLTHFRVFFPSRYSISNTSLQQLPPGFWQHTPAHLSHAKRPSDRGGKRGRYSHAQAGSFPGCPCFACSKILAGRHSSPHFIEGETKAQDVEGLVYSLRPEQSQDSKTGLTLGSMHLSLLLVAPSGVWPGVYGSIGWGDCCLANGHIKHCHLAGGGACDWKEQRFPACLGRFKSPRKKHSHGCLFLF